MTESYQDTFIRAFAMLSSLRDNVDKIQEQVVKENYVEQFDTVLGSLESIGIDVSQFRIPTSQVKPRSVGPTITRYPDGKSRSQPKYSEENYVDKPLLLTKLDATIKYIVMLIPDKARKIGFDTPHSQ